VRSSLSNSTTPRRSYCEQYALITSRQDVINFDPTRGVALCIGIDQQYHKNYEGKSLGVPAANDANNMGGAFVTKLGINQEQVQVFTSLAQPEQCTKAGIRNLFTQSARKTKEDGIFIFYFAGHGYLVKHSVQDFVSIQCVLAPSDFDGVKDKSAGVYPLGIYRDDVVKWLDGCKAKHVLIILDCCYAGDLGTSLTSPKNIQQVVPSISVMSGCAAGEKCITIPVLGNSIFTYFFLSYLEKHGIKGQFPVNGAMDEISELCTAFSSLLMKSDNGGLLSSMFTPTLDRRDVEEVDANIDDTNYSRLRLLISFYDKSPKSSPHLAVASWFNWPIIQKSIDLLKSNTPFDKRLQTGILCSMLYSAASIQLHYNKECLTERNLFIRMVVDIVAAAGLDTLSIDQLRVGLNYYYDQVSLAGLELKFLDKLRRDINRIAGESDPTINKFSPYFIEQNNVMDGTDETDGSTNKVQVIVLLNCH